MSILSKYFLFIILLFLNFQEDKNNKYSQNPPSGGQGAWSFHDFHTSLTEVQYNAKEKSLEVSIRVFTDDLEAALTKLNNGQKVVVNAPNDKANPLVEKYIQQHFVILNPQKQRKTFTYIGKELEGEATWIYVEFPNCGDLQSNNHILQNTILLELFDDQSNLVNFFYGKIKKTFLFNQKTKFEEIAW